MWNSDDLMDSRKLFREFVSQARTLFPLFRYLLLRTETHAFCLALACAALIGFYPFCVLLLSLMKNQLHWDTGYQVMVDTLRAFYPSGQDVLIYNLEISVKAAGQKLEFGSVLWVFLGAAGVFIPLEAGLNRLWKVDEDRTYWHNQLVGLMLTIASCVLAIAFIAINAIVKIVVGLPFGLLERLWRGFSIIEGTLTTLVLHLTAAAFFAIAVFVFYKFLPNRKVDAIQVLPAAILVGIAGEIMKDIYVFLLPWMDIRDNQGSQGPFFMSVSFVLLGYFETFVVLGGAFLATHTEHYPWMGFIPSRRSEGSDKAVPTIT
jgi:uncharacterized BrkB/YihY/UPF0761 family membrane protein